ncbi:hypothetical protein [Burkholderia sp. GbtcB21]|uniref:hypothetical protein n=1 Tax=Burkholderia sp. GbtcB21 TaxID=2824766 RepID=UPI001C2F3D9D|nr:hypothetical protein [Burkholderia sp. GbtcB21]
MLELNSMEVNSVGGGTHVWIPASMGGGFDGEASIRELGDNVLYNCSRRWTYENGREVTLGGVCFAVRPLTEQEIQMNDYLWSICQNC